MWVCASLESPVKQRRALAHPKAIRYLPESLPCRSRQARVSSLHGANCAYKIRKLAPRSETGRLAKGCEAMFSWSVL